MSTDPTPILRIAHVPPPSVTPKTVVRDAVRQMTERRVGAVAVVEDGRLVGIFTERDLMTKVVQQGLDPDSTPVREVMVEDPLALPPTAARSLALERMIQGHFRHVPIVDESRRVLGMLSIRHLLQERLEAMKQEVDSLESYLSADGPGG
jgi:CBS domain-containing protein